MFLKCTLSKSHFLVCIVNLEAHFCRDTLGSVSGASGHRALKGVRGRATQEASLVQLALPPAEVSQTLLGSSLSSMCLTCFLDPHNSSHTSAGLLVASASTFLPSVCQNNSFPDSMAPSGTFTPRNPQGLLPQTRLFTGHTLNSSRKASGPDW